MIIRAAFFLLLCSIFKNKASEIGIRSKITNDFNAINKVCISSTFSHPAVNLKNNLHTFLTSSLRTRSYKLISWSWSWWSWWRNFQTWKILKIWWYLENGKFEKKFEENMKKKIWIRKFKKRKFEKKFEKGKFDKGNLT